MSSSPLSINGASTRENINVEEDPWGFLGTHPSEQESQIKETLKELSAPITALTFLETPVTNIPQLFKSMSGCVEGVNPFIRRPATADEFVATVPALKEPVTRFDIERLLRVVLIANFDPVQSLGALLCLVDAGTLARIKRTIVVSLEVEADCKAWNSWKEFSGTRPELYSEVRRRKARETFTEFWRVAENLLKEVVVCLKETVTERGSPTEDVEKMLKRWRDTPGYFRDSSSWQDVLDRERVLFDTLSPKIAIEWSARSKHLMKLLSREEMGLTQSVIDSRLIELEEAEGYDYWLATVQKVLKLATVKALSFRKVVEKKKAEAPAPRPHTEPTAHRADKAPVIKIEPPRPNTAWCSFCRRAGHTFSECRTKDKPHRGQAGSCFICGGNDHWANQCSKRAASGASAEQPAHHAAAKQPVAKSTQAPLPQQAGPVAQPQTSRYGRTIKPTQSRSLHTQGTEAAVDGDAAHACPEAPCDPQLPAEPRTCRTVAEDEIPPRSRESAPRDVPMPSVRVIVDSEDDLEDMVLTGLIDTGSNLSYVSRSIFDRLRCLRGTEATEKESVGLFGVETMNGVEHRAGVKHTHLTVAIEDSAGERSSFRRTAMIIHERDKIPGGYDFLLAADWVVEEKLGIRGVNSGFEILLPQPPLADAATMTGPSAISLHSINYDPPEIENADDYFEEGVIELGNIIAELPAKAILMGPLSESHLLKIKAEIHDPPVTLSIQPDKLEPPAVKFGFPAPLARQEKLFELLGSLEDEGVIRSVPRGSGRYLCPGFAARKSGDRVRLLIDYTAVNQRLVTAPGVRHHDSSTWMHSLPSWATHYASVDVKDAYYRIAVAEESRPYLHMSIWSPTGLLEYEWLRMPQGLSVAPAYWCSLIESTVQSLLNFMESSGDPRHRELLELTRVICYFDDVLICARDEAACAEMLALVRQTLTYSGMYLPDSKVQLPAREIQIMGLKLSAGQMSMNNVTVDKMHNLKRPSSRRELRAALGLLNYVRWSLPNRDDPTSNALSALYQLAQDGTRFAWGPLQERAWSELVLMYRDGLPISCFSLLPGVENTSQWSLLIETDASDTAVGFCTYLVRRIPEALLDSPGEIDLAKCKEGSRLINVGSRRLTGTERNYAPHDREGLGIFFALQSNKSLILLIGDSLLATDNKTSLARLQSLDVGDTSSTRGRRWLRWVIDLADLLFPMSRGGRKGLVRFRHIPGPQNCLADFLSRYISHDLEICEIATQTDDSSPPLILTTLTTTRRDDAATPPLLPTTSPHVDERISELLSKWETDSSSLYVKRTPLQSIHQFLTDGKTTGTPAQQRLVEQLSQRRFRLLANGALTYNDAIVVPDTKFASGEPLRTYLIKHAHEDSPLAAHRGQVSTLAALRRSFWWPGMDSDVANWVSTCVPCILRKGTATMTSGAFNPRRLSAPCQLLLVDWCGPFAPSAAGYQYVILLVDGFSGYSIAIPYRHKSAENTCDALLHWASLLGTPERWASDNDSTFIAATCRHMRAMLGIKDEPVPTYSPTTQGAVERAVRTLKEGIETCLLAQADDAAPIDWPTLIKACVFTANATERYAGVSPFEVMLGRKPADPMTATFGVIETRSDVADIDEYTTKLKDRLLDIQDYWKSKSMETKFRTADRECGHTTPLDHGDRCVRVSYISGRRLVHGCVRILEKIGTNTYKVLNDDNDQTELCHGYQLIKIPDHPDRAGNDAAADPTNDQDDHEYFEIEKIREYQPQQGYLVKWVGYPESDNSWQKAADMPTSFRKQMASARKRYVPPL